jgi:hypothetical protein
MAIGMGECREKVRGALIEVSLIPRCGKRRELKRCLMRMRANGK